MNIDERIPAAITRNVEGQLSDNLDAVMPATVYLWDAAPDSLTVLTLVFRSLFEDGWSPDSDGVRQFADEVEHTFGETRYEIPRTGIENIVGSALRLSTPKKKYSTQAVVAALLLCLSTIEAGKSGSVGPRVAEIVEALKVA